MLTSWHRTWSLAARPKTLPAAVVPVWLGTVLAHKLGEATAPWLALCALLSAACIQIGTNFFNDALDFQKGSDTGHRLGPARATASGLRSARQVLRAGVLVLGVACLLALPLIQARGWPILAIGIPSLYFAFGYTGGPWPLAYRGLGELFVLLFFGLIAATGAVYVNTGKWLAPALLLGVQIGLYSTALIAINNLRDQAEDAITGKRTLAVRLGTNFARWEIAATSLLPPVLGLLGWPWKGVAWGPCAVAPLSLFLVVRIFRSPPSAGYNRYLALAGGQLLAFAAAFTLGALL